MKTQAHLSGARTVGRPAIITLCVGMVVLLFVAELAAPPYLTLGAALVIPIVVAWTLLGPRWGIAVLLLAVASRAVEEFVGDVQPGLAGVEIISYFVVGGVIAVTLPRLTRKAPAAPHDIEPQRQPPHLEEAEPLPSAAAGVAFTARERQVLLMTMHGLTAAQVGERLLIGRRTVESHLNRAYSKLGVRSKREFIALVFDGKVDLS
jgi:DNA-binding CsgD family transcriptional regulator